MSSSRRPAIMAAGVIAGFVVVALVVVLLGALGGRSTAAPVGHGSYLPRPSATVTGSAPAADVIPAPHLSAAQVDALTPATTHSTVAAASVDLTTASGGAVVRVPRTLAGFARPGADPITAIPPTQIGTPTWLPVIDHRSGWLRVRLPSRPNGATAWIPATGLQQARTAWSVHIALGTGRMTITRDGKAVGQWPIGQGRAATPTPVGDTFVVAGFVDPVQDFSPVIYALGTHSQTLDTFGGGPGTVAVHGWPTATGRSGRISHGCVRVPADALTTFGELPAGTPVSITS